jgi:hypothetical protein
MSRPLTLERSEEELDMRTRLLPLAALMLSALGWNAFAQGPPGFGNLNQPPVSPYLNINRLGASPAVNYYNIVQPQLQFASQIAQLNQQTNQIQGAVNQGATGGPESLRTGHMAYFGNYSHYYGLRRTGLGTGSLLGTGGLGGFGGRGLQTPQMGSAGRPPSGAQGMGAGIPGGTGR